MGKHSRNQQQRNDRSTDPVGAIMAPFTSTSLFPVIEAAAASPSAAHRGLSIAMLFNELVQHPPHGSRTAIATDLQTMLELLPHLPEVEDFAPYDSRDQVLIRWANELFRVLPGSLERPTARLNQQALLADAIDPILVSRLGFGLSDVGELILRRVNDVAQALAPYWPPGEAAVPGDPASVTQSEVEAASTLQSFDDIVEKCTHPGQARAAAARYTVSVRDLAPVSAYAPATFGAAIATRNRGHVRPIPAAYLVEALPAIGRDLAGQAATAPEAGTAFKNSVQSRVASRFKGSGQLITGLVRIGSSNPLHSLVVHHGRQVIALNVVAALDPTTFEIQLREGDDTLRRVTAGVEFETRAGAHTLPANAEIVHAHVIAWPHPEILLDARYPVLTLEDLDWILYTARHTPEDLWYFLRDLSRSAEAGNTFAWDMIDRWEVWRQEKSFYRGGKRLDHLMFAAHHAAEEWEDAATNAPIEKALLALGLRPLRDWPIVVPEYRSGAEVGDLGVDEVWHVLPLPVPVAVATTDPSAPRGHRSALARLAISIAWKLDRCADAFRAAAARSGVTSLRVVFLFRERDDGPPLTAGHADDSGITVGWDSRLLAALAEDSIAVERLAGQIVAQALDPDARAAFIQAWAAAPPGIRVDGLSLNQQAGRLSDPIVANGSVRAEVLRHLGEFLISTTVEPGLLEDAEATRFESATVFPWLIARFHEVIADLSADALLEFALGQLECVHHQRFMLDKKLGWELGFPTGHEGNRSEDIDKLTKQIRVVSLVVEEVLAHPPAGNGAVDAVAWIDVVSVADLCLDSCVRSDAIHNKLTHTAVRVTDNYEVVTISSDKPTDIDFADYQRLRTLHTLPAPVPMATGQGTAVESENGSSEPIMERMPQLKPIDTALRSDLGFGLDAMLGLLAIATRWDAGPQNPATLTTPAALVDARAQFVAGAERAEAAAALEWLTLHGRDLSADVIPHWETERRPKRVQTSPFIASGDMVWVLPWTAEAALRVFLNYLSDGRLPRPRSALPTTINSALEQYRQTRNREAEKECTAALTVSGLVTRSSVKPEKRSHYGISNLSGEIDTLCIVPHLSRIWVVEVKDSYTPYSHHQVRRLIDTFNKPGRYVDKLLVKVSNIQESASSVAAKLGVSEADRLWTVLGLMVTPHLEPAAFTVGAEISYCILSDVLDVITQNAVPSPGLHGPSVEPADDTSDVHPG